MADNHKEIARLWAAKNRQENREKVNAAQRVWKRRHRPYVADTNLRQKYGISLEDKHTMLQAQAGRCALCKKVLDATNTFGVQVDHNHITGKVRGLLCPSCNHGLGQFHDDIELLNAAIKYLTERN